MKPFDLELAKQGHPVCTRGGHKARIVAYDYKNSDYPIVALIEGDSAREYVNAFTIEGKDIDGKNTDDDLMMEDVIHKKYIVLKKEEGKLRIASDVLFHSIEMAKCYKRNCKGATTILKIEWEE